MLSRVQKLINVSELRRNLSKYLSQSATDPVVVSAGHSSGTRVLLDSELYNKLISTYEDDQDAELLEKLVSSDDGHRISLEEVKAKMCK